MGYSKRQLQLTLFTLLTPLALFTTSGRLLALEANTIEGRLDSSSEILEDNTYYNIHTFEGIEGEQITIELISEQFDAYLILLDAERNKVAGDDDGGGGDNAKIVVTLPTTGLYIIVVNTYNEQEIGNYQLSWRDATATEISQIESDEVRQERSEEVAQTSQASQEAIRAEAQRLWDEGDQLFNQGTAEALQQAILKWQEALPLYQRIGDQSREALINLALGRVHDLLGEKQQALGYYIQALPLFQAVGDHAGEATNLNNIGLIYAALGEKQQALDYYTQALLLWRAVGDRAEGTIREVARAGEATALTNIGRVYDDLGYKKQALDYYVQVLPLFQVVGDHGGEANIFNNIGGIYDDLGEKQKALDYFSRALSLFQMIGDHAGEANIFNNIGGIYDSLGEKQKALDYYNQALPLRRVVSDRAGEAVTLNNIGGLYYDLGDKQLALDYFQQALPLSRMVRDRTKEATILNNIASIYNDLGEKQKAIEYLNQSLLLIQSVDDRSGEATILSNIGNIYNDLGKNAIALEYFHQALPLHQAVGNPAREAATLNNIGGAYNDSGEKATALDYFQQALALRGRVGDRAGEATTLSNIASIERDRGNLQQALTSIQASLEIIEDLRTKVASPELRQSYFATVQGYYSFYIDLLMELHQQDPTQGYDREAFHASERSRARSLLELLTEANADIRQGVNPDLLEAERNLQFKLDAIEKQRVELYSSNTTTDAQKADIEQQRQQLLSEYSDIQAQIRATSPRYAALTQPEPLTLQQVQQSILDDDTLLLQYSLGENRSFLWAITKDSFTSYELPPEADIETAAKQFRDALLNPLSRNLTPKKITTTANDLSALILQPVAEQLNKKRVVIVADGALSYIPFATLPLPGSENPNSITPLVSNYEIVNLPSSSTLGILREHNTDRQTASKTVAILADPVFSKEDCRLQGNGDCDEATQRGSEENVATDASNVDQLLLSRSASEVDIGVWDRLPGTRQEAESIIALVPEEERTHAFDFTANREAVTNPELNSYRIVHFATHGILNSTSPELSGVVLSLVNEQGESENGFLRLHDIFNLDLPAELVVLSACSTGLGEEVKGEGLVGLTRGFMYAGAPRVVVSLWNVNDTATAEFMTRFYRLLLEENQTPAQALRNTQLEMQQETEWKSPYYWAAFTLQGEWE